MKMLLICRGPMGSGMEEIYQVTSALKHLKWGKQVEVARFSRGAPSEIRRESGTLPGASATAAGVPLTVQLPPLSVTTLSVADLRR